MINASPEVQSTPVLVTTIRSRVPATACDSTFDCSVSVSVDPKVAVAAAPVPPPPVNLTKANEYPKPSVSKVIPVTAPPGNVAVADAPVPSPSIVTIGALVYPEPPAVTVRVSISPFTSNAG